MRDLAQPLNRVGIENLDFGENVCGYSTGKETGYTRLRKGDEERRHFVSGKETHLEEKRRCLLRPIQTSGKETAVPFPPQLTMRKVQQVPFPEVIELPSPSSCDVPCASRNDPGQASRAPASRRRCRF
jgi:hypothetical protein